MKADLQHSTNITQNRGEKTQHMYVCNVMKIKKTDAAVAHF